jgi:hypothetical protein
MPIDKLSNTFVDMSYVGGLREQEIHNKINELISAFNTLEQDRSEQMARLVDRLDTQAQILRDHNARIYDRENDTQPKDKELLKNCPWCGSLPITFNLNYGKGIGCSNTECVDYYAGKVFDTKQEAVNAWNTRV